MKYNISAIIPAYKEEQRIKRCIEESLFFFRNAKIIDNFELIFVADQSGDETIDIIKEYLPKNKEIHLIVNDERQQKGGSVKIGVIKAKYEYILFYDVDLSTPLYEINETLELMKNHDIVIGSRGMKQSKIEKKPFKIFLSKGFSLLKWIILGLHFTDTQCGFKMFKRKTLCIFEKQQLRSSCFDVELLYIAKKYGFTIKEKPITWIDSDMSNFNTVKVVFSFLFEILKIRKHDLLGYYNKRD